MTTEMISNEAREQTVSPGGISDAISGTARFFSIDEILLLENLTYLVDRDPFRSLLRCKGKTVCELLNDITLTGIDEFRDYGSYLTGRDWLNLIRAIRRNRRLLEAEVRETYIDRAYGGGGGVAAVFVCEELKEAVVAFRGTAPNEWADDFAGSNVTDTLQQINALEWYRAVWRNLKLRRYYITLTGHSKGGNKAKYIAILDDTPDRCISFDGQGFSDKFITHYRERILKRQGVILNCNIDYDYVNILLNDIGERRYYLGHDYGRGGLLESHCPNTFFRFSSDGSYEITLNPRGQSTEMQLLDRFLNSYIRTMPSDKETTEAAVLLGMLVEHGFGKGDSEQGRTEYLNFICDMVADPVYSDNVAFLAAYTIKYERLHPGFLSGIRDLLVRFGMGGFLKYLEYARAVMNYKGLDKILGVTNFLAGRIPAALRKKLCDMVEKKFGIVLTDRQLLSLLSIVSQVAKLMETLEICDNGADLTLEETAPVEDNGDVLYRIQEHMNIVVLAGGYSADRNISLRTGRAVAASLRRMGHNVILLDTWLGWSGNSAYLEDPFAHAEEISIRPAVAADVLPDLWAVKKRRAGTDSSIIGPNVLALCRKADLVFVALHSAFGENGRLQAALDLLSVDYTGCGFRASTLSVSKVTTKRMLRCDGIPTPEWVAVNRWDGMSEALPQTLQYPVVVKPACGGSGIGITVVSDPADLSHALTEAFRWEDEVVIERLIPGREFSVCVVGSRVLPVMEISLPGSVLDYRNRGSVDYTCPAALSPKETEALQTLALRAAEAVGLSVYYRIDFRRGEDGTQYVLECDSLPELAEDSIMARCAAAAGMDFDALCRSIVEESLTK